MSSQKEIFNYEGLSKQANELDVLFNDFGQLLKQVNDSVNDLVNVGPDSAFYGSVGTRLLALWNENSSTFGDFKANFDKWSKMVAAITANNKTVEENVFAIYRSTGGRLDGVEDSRNKLRGEMAMTGEDIEVEKVVISPDDTLDATYTGGILAADDAYAVATEGRTAAQMYQDACDLKNEIYVEIEYLSDYQRDLEYARSALELNKDSMDSAAYNELMTEYNLRISTCETELLKRSNLYNDLNTVTADNFGTTDGALKDAQDWGSNDLVVAKETLFGINEAASTLKSVDSISREYNGIGENAEQTNALSISAVYSSDMNDYGAYSGNLDGVSTYANSSVSNLTMRSAYAAAGENVIELNTAPGVYLFNTKDYLLNPEIQGNYPMGGVTSIPETSALSVTSYQGMDSVYDSNTGKYYTYDQWNSMQSGNGQ